MFLCDARQGLSFPYTLPLRATADRFTASRASHRHFNRDAAHLQLCFNRHELAGMKDARTPITADSNSAPYAARAAFSSRHRAPRRRQSLGAIYEQRLSLCPLQRTTFQGRANSSYWRRRNQMSALQNSQRTSACEPTRDCRLSSLRRIALWLHLPPNIPASPECHFVQDMPDSTSDCISPNPDIALCVTSSGKPMQRQLSWRGWPTRPWIKRLFGTILNPLTERLGAAKFISSLPDIHANPSASQACEKALMIQDIFGQTSRESSAKSSRAGFSQRMSKATSIWDVPTSAKAFADWVTLQKRACSQRAKQAQATGVAASSSWPTPTALDSGHFVDLMVGGGIMQPIKTINLGPASTGQMPLSNAARGWTAMWLILKAAGWHPQAVVCHSLPPVRVTFWHGKNSLTNGLISNPRFYEMVMGWPIGWTKAEVPVTAFAAWLQRSRGQLSKLTLNGDVL